MKGLGIEQKAKRFDEALAMAKECITYVPDDAVKEYMLNMFPELKESEDEDEKIRKELIDYHRSMAAGADDYVHETWIAWLEKQGKSKSYSWKPTKEQYEALDYAYNSCSDTERGNYYEGVLETLIEDLHRLEKQSEQKTVDNVNPKFKVGDWIVNGFGDVWYIDSFDSKNYQVSNEDKHFYFPIKEQNEMNLWTIKDAKDGDILISCKNQPFIYNGEFDKYCVGAHCGLNIVGEFIAENIRSYNWTINSNIRPATKEQRETLFKAMHEAGYEWDDEKKEPKKINNDYLFLETSES